MKPDAHHYTPQLLSPGRGFVIAPITTNGREPTRKIEAPVIEYLHNRGTDKDHRITERPNYHL